MPIRFAASLKRRHGRMPAARVRRMPLRAVNDNPGEPAPNCHLHAALRHFAEHGLAAADHARDQAMCAADAGDRQSFEWWVEICRTLDRRMASAIPMPAIAGG